MRIVLIGGFCEMEELCQRAGYEIVRVVGPSEDGAYLKDGDKAIPIVITPDGTSRSEIAVAYQKAGFAFVTITAKTADVSESAQIGVGTVIAEHAVVSARAKLGDFVKINTAAVVTHECEISDGATVAPRATILGRVKIGSCAYVGANATILPGLVIGSNAVIGAGAVVTHDVPSGETWMGVPARKVVKKI